LDTFKILGDDIVIRDDRLAVHYRETLQGLDVPISWKKTMQSKTTFEFAKRWFHNGTEVSPFPLNAVHEHLTFPLGLVETFRTASEKGWNFSKTGTGPGLVNMLWKAHGINPAFARKLSRDYQICSSFPREISSTDEGLLELAKFLRALGSYVSCVS